MRLKEDTSVLVDVKGLNKNSPYTYCEFCSPIDFEMNQVGRNVKFW